MLDVVVRNGTVVDGSGEPGRRADVGVADGRIVSVGDVDDEASSTIDAEGLVVAPGFVDLHTHYDAQLFYDPDLSPSPLHGVTTVVAGNCGLTLAPVDPSDQGWLTRLLANVESIPAQTIEAGVEFAWKTFAEFLDVVGSRPLGANIGFMVGHSAIRRAVMSEAASSSAATPEQLEAMCALLGECLAAGGLGFSTANAATQVDGDGRPTPPNFATREEFVALAAVCGHYPGTSIEFIPDSFIRGFTDEDVDLMADMSAAADRPLNWNTPLVNRQAPDLYHRQLRATDAAIGRGGRVVPMFMPQNQQLQHDFSRGYVFRAIPGWGWLFQLDVPTRLEALQDPEKRAQLERAAAEATSGLAMVVRNWASYRLNEVVDPAQAALEGRSVADLAQEWNMSPFDAMVEAVVRCGLQVGLVRSQYAPDDTWSWEARLEVLKDPRVVLQASDAGAHLDMMAGADFPTQCLAELVRARGAFTLEEMVRQLSRVPADLYGFSDRGRLERGARADIAVFDPGTVGATPLRTVQDLPAGAARLTTRSVGMRHVLVGGRETVRDGEFTGDRGGTVLRSGRDNVTVTARAS
ncbi:MAG TPA: amidohydrolase family protein [Acidimicrobiales bacterium]|nr:amidohydrolase family protein [Acidimicrobiales bacterium]